MPFHTLLKIKMPEKALQSNAMEKLWLLTYLNLTIFLE